MGIDLCRRFLHAIEFALRLALTSADVGDLRSYRHQVALGGLVLERLGRPAAPGDRVRLANVEFEVREIRGARIRSLAARILDDEEVADG